MHLPKILAAPLAALLLGQPVAAQVPDTILYGVAYYDEYTPVDRVEEDARMMREAGINVVRIAESTWGTLERQPGVFDFSHVDRVLAAMQRQGISVIVGTPTYAIPTWLAREHPNVLAITPQGPMSYGRRQNMDITDPDYRAAAERVIVALIDHVKDHPAVIGYQIDNETKSYNTSGPRVQAAFVAAMQQRWPDIDAMNDAYGLDYWSNRINRWEDFPSVNGSINASLSNAFAEFQRQLVTDFLQWQADLVRVHARPSQFITHNFDFDWRGYSFGIQPEVNHWQAGRALDVVGVDIYHPGQDELTGAEIAFGGDVARSINHGQNYLVVETQAQGFPQWTPYPGQLRLQAYSHIASGAEMIGYWHWASTANAFETYWRGLLSQDYQPNPTFEEATRVGAELQRIGPTLAGMSKSNRVAIYVSNRALSAFNSFPPGGSQPGTGTSYNEVLRLFYDALYRINVETDFISPDAAANLDDYDLIIVPALYAASDEEITNLNAYAYRGGHLLYTFKSGFSDENNKVRYDTQPGAIADAAGVTYQQFTLPHDVSLAGNPFGVSEEDNQVRLWMEMLVPTTAEVVARYQHASWPSYAAMTRNAWGQGQVSYLGFMPSPNLAELILSEEVDRAGILREANEARFPVIVRSGTLRDGRTVRYVLNFSAEPQVYVVRTPGTDLLTDTPVPQDAAITLEPWGLVIMAAD